MAMTDPVEARREMALKIGVEAAFDPFTDGLDQKLEALCPTLVFDCAGDVGTFDQSVRIAARAARIVGVAFTRKPVSIDTNKALRKELTASFMLRFAQDFDRSIQLLARERDRLRSLVTHQFPFDVQSVEEAYSLMDGYADGIVKAVVRFE